MPFVLVKVFSIGIILIDMLPLEFSPSTLGKAVPYASIEGKVWRRINIVALNINFAHNFTVLIGVFGIAACKRQIKPLADLIV